LITDVYRSARQQGLDAVVKKKKIGADGAGPVIAVQHARNRSAGFAGQLASKRSLKTASERSDSVARR
jgi:hypothetical protein